MPVSRKTRKAIKEYYEYHGDMNLKIVREIKDKQGFPMVLVRFTDSAPPNKELSALVNTYSYISEFTVVERAEENEMVKGYEEND